MYKWTVSLKDMQESDIGVWERRRGVRMQGKAMASSSPVYTYRAGNLCERGHLGGDLNQRYRIRSVSGRLPHRRRPKDGSKEDPATM